MRRSPLAVLFVCTLLFGGIAPATAQRDLNCDDFQYA